MDKTNEGTKGIGCEGYSKYSPESAPVTKNGGNTEDQDGIVTTASETKYYGRPTNSMMK